MTSDYSASETLVLNTCSAFERGEFPSLHAAALAFHAPYQRVLARYDGRASRSERAPTNRLLDATEESGLLIWLDRLNQLGTRPSQRMLEHECNFILARRHNDPNSRPPRYGEK